MSSYVLSSALCAEECCLQATLTGKPGAAYIDVPSDVLFAEASSSEIPAVEGITPPDHSVSSPLLKKPRASSRSVSQAVKLLSQAQR